MQCWRVAIGRHKSGDVTEPPSNAIGRPPTEPWQGQTDGQTDSGTRSEMRCQLWWSADAINASCCRRRLLICFLSSSSGDTHTLSDLLFCWPLSIPAQTNIHVLYIRTSVVVLGLAGLVICQTNNTATMLKSTFIAWMKILCSTNL